MSQDQKLIIFLDSLGDEFPPPLVRVAMPQSFSMAKWMCMDVIGIFYRCYDVIYNRDVLWMLFCGCYMDVMYARLQADSLSIDLCNQQMCGIGLSLSHLSGSCKLPFLGDSVTNSSKLAIGAHFFVQFLSNPSQFLCNFLAFSFLFAGPDADVDFAKQILQAHDWDLQVPGWKKCKPP